MLRFCIIIFSPLFFSFGATAQVDTRLSIGASNCAIAKVLKIQLPPECRQPPLGQTRGIVIHLNNSTTNNPIKPSSLDIVTAKTSTKTAPKKAPQTIATNHAAAKSENGYYIHFAFNSFELEPDYKQHLTRLSSVLTSNAMLTSCLRITGHTDSVGSDEYNLILSEKRAVMVASFLADLGAIDPSRIQLSAAGETSPLPEIKSTDPRNRRVEFLTKDSADGCS